MEEGGGGGRGEGEGEEGRRAFLRYWWTTFMNGQILPHSQDPLYSCVESLGVRLGQIFISAHTNICTCLVFSKHTCIGSTQHTVYWWTSRRQSKSTAKVEQFPHSSFDSRPLPNSRETSYPDGTFPVTNNQSINQSINRSMNQPIIWSINQSINHLIGWLIQQINPV